MISLYKLEKENDELKRYVQFLEIKCREYEKYYDIEIQCKNSLGHFVPTTEDRIYDTEVIRIPERKFLVGCQDLSEIRKNINDVIGE